MSLREEVLAYYLDAQRGLTELEQIDENNVVLSLPLHVSANTRIELAVTRISKEYFAISDMARTVGELKDAGYGINAKLREKIESIAHTAGLKFAGNHLIRECSASEIGEAIHQFADAAKTIGDAYLTYRSPKTKGDEDELVSRVRRVFTERQYVYKERQEVSGDIEKHTVDFYIPPNGSGGVALAVLANPTQLLAEAWGFKTQDIKRAHKNLAVSVVYDSSRAKEVSKNILDKMADIPVPSNVIDELGDMLKRRGIYGHKK